jgi:hypothetical protein
MLRANMVGYVVYILSNLSFIANKPFILNIIVEKTPI